MPDLLLINFISAHAPTRIIKVTYALTRQMNNHKIISTKDNFERILGIFRDQYVQIDYESSVLLPIFSLFRDVKPFTSASMYPNNQHAAYNNDSL